MLFQFEFIVGFKDVLKLPCVREEEGLPVASPTDDLFKLIANKHCSLISLRLQVQFITFWV